MDDDNRNAPAAEAAMFDDRNHWRVDLRGLIQGQPALRSYHLAAASKAEARVNALTRWAVEFDAIPLATTVERYSTWRAHEGTEEGPCGMPAHSAGEPGW